MMRILCLGVFAACLALATAGCSRSPRVTFYTLEPAAAVPSAPTAAPAAPAVAPLAAPLTVAVGPVTLPEIVDRPQFVVRAAANRVDILEEQRWAEPLRSEIPRVIAGDLGRLLGSSRVLSYLENAGSNAEFRVLLDIERFEASPGKGVTVVAAWSLHKAAGGAARTGRSRVHEPAAGEGCDPLVAAYGRALLAVSADLAQAIRDEGAAGR